MSGSFCGRAHASSVQVVKQHGGHAGRGFCAPLLDVAQGLGRQADRLCKASQRPAPSLKCAYAVDPGGSHAATLWHPIDNSQSHPITDFHNHSGMTTVGKRIRRERQEQKLSRQALADLVPIPYPTLAGIENDDQLGSTRLHAIAAALGVSARWLETGRGLKDAKKTSRESQPLILDPSIMAEALALLHFDEHVAGDYSLHRESARLCELYARALRDGGRLSLFETERFEQEVQARKKQGISGEATEEKVGSAKRRVA